MYCICTAKMMCLLYHNYAVQIVHCILLLVYLCSLRVDGYKEARSGSSVSVKNQRWMGFFYLRIVIRKSPVTYFPHRGSKLLFFANFFRIA